MHLAEWHTPILAGFAYLFLIRHVIRHSAPERLTYDRTHTSAPGAVALPSVTDALQKLGLARPHEPRTLSADLDAAVMSRNPPSRAQFQGRDRTFFFITGLGRSGTNWLGRMLRLHPGIHVPHGEFQFRYFWEEGFRQFKQIPWSPGSKEPYRTAAREGLHDLLRRVLLSTLEEKPEAVAICDKSPRPFSVLLPGCVHLHLVRDGRDHGVSFTFHQLYMKGQRPSTDNWPDGLLERFMPYFERAKAEPDAGKDIAAELLADEQWTRFIAQRWSGRVMRDREAIADSRQSLPNTPIRVVQYEEMHADPNAVRFEVYRMLGLEPDAAASLEDGEDTTPGLGREKLGSLRRKGIIGDWRNYANPTFINAYKQYASEALIAERYEQDASW